MDLDMAYFDEVDRRYFDGIREALEFKDVDKLCTLVPSLTETEAEDYINKYHQVGDIMMDKIKASIDTTEESSKLYDILKELFIKSGLSSKAIRK